MMQQALTMRKVQALILAAIAVAILAIGLSFNTQTAYAKPVAAPGLAVGETGTAVAADGTVYTLKNKSGSQGLTVIGVKTTAKNLKIPESIEVNGKVQQIKAIGTKAFADAKSVTKVTLPKTIYRIEKKAFANSKVKTLIVKTMKLKKKTVKGSLKGSKVKTVQVKVGNKKLNKKYVAKYKKIFTKKNCGKKVTVK